MIIAIDARALVSQKPAGKEKFTINILEELFKLDRQNQYILYLTRDCQRSLPGNFLKKVIKAPNIFWHLFVLIDLIFKKPDLFFAPLSYIVPSLNIFSKNIIIVYDLCVFLPIRTGVNFKTSLLERMFLGIAAKRAEKIITISESTKKDIAKYFRINPSKILITYPGLNQNIAMGDNSREILNKYNLPPDFLLFVGTLEPRKNIVRLIEAYHRLIINYQLLITNFKLVIVGKRGWHYQEIFEKVKKLQLENRVVFLNYVSDEDLPYLYNSAACFIYPSLYEGFGLPVLEAMACGCPVITSNVSSLPEVVGEAGILIDPYNIDEIAEALQKVLTDENLRQELKRKGLEQARKFSWEKTARGILKILCG